MADYLVVYKIESSRIFDHGLSIILNCYGEVSEMLCSSYKKHVLPVSESYAQE